MWPRTVNVQLLSLSILKSNPLPRLDPPLEFASSLAAILTFHPRTRIGTTANKLGLDVLIKAVSQGMSL